MNGWGRTNAPALGEGLVVRHVLWDVFRAARTSVGLVVRDHEEAVLLEGRDGHGVSMVCDGEPGMPTLPWAPSEVLCDWGTRGIERYAQTKPVLSNKWGKKE